MEFSGVRERMARSTSARRCDTESSVTAWSLRTGSRTGAGGARQQFSRHALSDSFFRIELRPSDAEVGQNAAVVTPYSACSTALPALRNGSSEAHSLYCAHCSLT